MSETMISHYRIVEKLGEGGMGVVYKAQDTRLNRPVALKILPPNLVDDAERRRRFKQEAQAASALNHPNIVTVYDIGETDGTMFIAMESVAGKTMEELIPRDGMHPPEVLKYAVQIADAFARAHAAGIVHRDLKPGNLMVTAEGLVKVLDFGLAKLTETGVLRDDTTVSMSPQTLRGTVLGTPAFMSPEQAAGETVDARSDIFSFGAVLYEMVTGQRAFRGDSQMATVAAVLSQEPSPLSAEVPPELAKIILRCLRKDRARRYQTMADLKVALEDVREELVSDRKVHAPSRRRWMWAVLPSIVLLAGFFVWLARRAPQDAAPPRAAALTTLPGVELYPSFSPDGNHVAFTWTGPKQDNRDIYVQLIGSGSPLRLTTDRRSDLNPVWSPDGRWIAFFRADPPGPLSQSDRELRLIPPLGGPERKLAEVRAHEFYPSPGYLAWSPDSKALVVTDSTGDGQPDALFVISLETGEKRQLTRPRPPVIADTSPAISPDGRSLVFLRREAWSSGELSLLSLEQGLTAGGEPKRLMLPALGADYPAWMPDGKEILFSARGSLWRMAISGETPERLPFVGEDGLMPVVSRPQPGGPARLIYVRSFTDENIWRVETSAPGAPSSSSPVVFISSTRSDLHPEFSPDGRRVVFTSTRSGEWEIWVADSDGSNPVQLTSMHAQNTGGPCWSPDGQLIAFASDMEGQFEIYEIPASGGKPRRVTSHPAFDHSPGFSSDGKWIYFSSTRTGEYQIWKVPVSGGDPVQVTSNGGFVPHETPDGAYLYYTEASATASRLWRLPTSGGQPVKLLDGVVWWDFVVLEKGIYYHGRSEGETRLQFFDFGTRTSTTVARNLGDIQAGLTATPDGGTILFNRIDSSVDDLMLVENFR